MNIRSSLLILAAFTVACGRGEKPNAGATASAGPPAAVPPTPAAPQPVTGKTWDVKMIADATGSRFDPPSLTIKAGDGVKFTLVSGPPHNVAFWPDSIPAGATSALQANMPQTMAPLNGPLLATAGETYVVSFAGATPGTYHYYCVPHLAAGMKATIVVQ